MRLADFFHVDSKRILNNNNKKSRHAFISVRRNCQKMTHVRRNNQGDSQSRLSGFVLANSRWPAAAPSSLFSLLEHCDLRLQVCSMFSVKSSGIFLLQNTPGHKSMWRSAGIYWEAACWTFLRIKLKEVFIYFSALILSRINPSFWFHL